MQIKCYFLLQKGAAPVNEESDDEDDEDVDFDDEDFEGEYTVFPFLRIYSYSINTKKALTSPHKKCLYLVVGNDR